MNRIDPPEMIQVQQWVRAVGERPVVILKHSPACGTSRRALLAFERYVQTAGAAVPADYFVVDVLAERPLSQALAKATGVTHQSPQVLILKNGMCVWNTSHISINEPALERQVNLYLATTPKA